MSHGKDVCVWNKHPQTCLRGLPLELCLFMEGPGLTLNVRGPSYLGLTRSISWLLMPWLLTSVAMILLYRMCRSFSYLRKDFKYVCHINVEEWHEMQISIYVSSKNLARKGSTYSSFNMWSTCMDYFMYWMFYVCVTDKSVLTSKVNKISTTTTTITSTTSTTASSPHCQWSLIGLPI